MVDLSNFSYDKVSYVAARVLHANSSFALVDLGFQAFMCIYGLLVFLESPKARRQGRLPYIIISFVILFFSTLSSGLDAYTQWKGSWEAHDGKSYYAVTAEIEASAPRILSYSCVLITMAVGDGLLLYRSYIIWQDKWWINVIPGLTYLASIAMGIRSIVPQSVPDVRVNASAWTFLTIAMNIMVTALIALRLLVASRSIGKLMPSRGLSYYTGVVAVLIEAALPLTFFGLGYAISLVVDAGITTASVSRWQIVNGLFSALYFTFVPISPQMIIFRVTTGRSWHKTPNAKSEPASHPIAFASGNRRPVDQSYYESKLGEDTDQSMSVGGEIATKQSSFADSKGYVV